MIPKILARKAKLAATAVIAAGLMAFGATTPAAAAYKLGVLQCDVAGGVGFIIGSQKSMSCTFTPNAGPPEVYTGTIRKFGLDVGVTAKTVIVWAVFAATQGYAPGSLAGSYGGASAEASLIVGAGANALVGGSNDSIALQPLSVQGQVGVNLAVGVTSLELH